LVILYNTVIKVHLTYKVEKIKHQMTSSVGNKKVFVPNGNYRTGNAKQIKAKIPASPG
jgi:hypothetical protein